ncbi:hypothetical protein, partial [Escherichia coli]|uniref:hypothetical protein n=1 Tax=Escherichia coli TaxID=562 RepID=UPI0039E1D59A
TQLTLPDWQLEPDDMANLSGPDAYMPTDNTVSPDGSGNSPTDNQPAPAANPDFLDNATGRQGDVVKKRVPQPSVGF